MPKHFLPTNFAYAIACLLLLTGGCAQEMMNQRRVESQEHTPLFDDGIASRRLPPHTITASRSALAAVSASQTPFDARHPRAARTHAEQGYWEGKTDGKLVTEIPPQALEHYNYRELLQRGQQRFDVSCSPCHDRTGSGNGMVARRGYKYPPSYHTDRLRGKPIGYIFNVATHGRGQMPSYGDFISTEDRWAIAAYVRTLQFSQYAPAEELNDSDLAEINAASKRQQQSRKAQHAGESDAGRTNPAKPKEGAS